MADVNTQVQPGAQTFQPSTGAYTGATYGQQPPAGATQGGSAGIFGGIDPSANFNNGIPNYLGLANQQAGYNYNNALDQYKLNNPNQTTPYGSRTTSYNADGTTNVNTVLSPEQQQQYNNSNQINTAIQNQAMGMVGNTPNGLDYSNLGSMPSLSYDSLGKMPQYDTSNLTAMPDASESDLTRTRDAQYAQQQQYLDPQYKNMNSDLDAKLANQGVMPGTEAYTRAHNELNLQQQKAYGDARNSSILAGGQEQSRLFGLGMQSRQQGVNEALNSFNTGMQGRQEGVAELGNVFNSGMQTRQQQQNEDNSIFGSGLQLQQSKLNSLTALKGLGGYQMPQFQGTSGVAIPGVDYLGAAQNGYKAQIDQNNADSARTAGYLNGAAGLAGMALQNPGAVSAGYNWLTGGNSGNTNFLNNNQGLMDSQGLSASDLYTAA